MPVDAFELHRQEALNLLSGHGAGPIHERAPAEVCMQPSLDAATLLLAWSDSTPGAPSGGGMTEFLGDGDIIADRDGGGHRGSKRGARGPITAADDARLEAAKARDGAGGYNSHAGGGPEVVRATVAPATVLPLTLTLPGAVFATSPLGCVPQVPSAARTAAVAATAVTATPESASAVVPSLALQRRAAAERRVGAPLASTPVTTGAAGASAQPVGPVGAVMQWLPPSIWAGAAPGPAVAGPRHLVRSGSGDRPPLAVAINSGGGEVPLGSAGGTSPATSTPTVAASFAGPRRATLRALGISLTGLAATASLPSPSQAIISPRAPTLSTGAAGQPSALGGRAAGTLDAGYRRRIASASEDMTAVVSMSPPPVMVMAADAGESPEPVIQSTGGYAHLAQRATQAISPVPNARWGHRSRHSISGMPASLAEEDARATRAWSLSNADDTFDTHGSGTGSAASASASAGHGVGQIGGDAESDVGGIARQRSLGTPDELVKPSAAVLDLTAPSAKLFVRLPVRLGCHGGCGGCGRERSGRRGTELTTEPMDKVFCPRTSDRSYPFWCDERPSPTPRIV